MFTLAELLLLQELTRKAAVSFEMSDIASSIKKKLLENIADLEQREARQKAAVQLRAVGSASSEHVDG